MALAKGEVKGKGTAKGDFRAKGARKALAKAEMGSTGLATTAEPASQEYVWLSLRLKWCWHTLVPRVQRLMQEEWTKSVCAVAKDTPSAGSRLVEAVVDSGAEASVAPPKGFP